MKIEPRGISIADLPGGLAARFAATSEFSSLAWLHYHGPLAILEASLTAFFCSRKVGSVEILRAYNQATELRHSRPAVIGGFHTPVERDCLKILLKGPAAVMFCPARGLSPTLLRGLPADLQVPLAEALTAGRLLVLSPFGPEVKRASRATAKTRNEFVRALADEVVRLGSTPSALLDDERSYTCVRNNFG